MGQIIAQQILRNEPEADNGNSQESKPSPPRPSEEEQISAPSQRGPGIGTKKGKLVLQRSRTLQLDDDFPDLEHLGDVVNIMCGRVPPKDETEKNMVRGSNTDEMAMNNELVDELFVRNAYLIRSSIGRIMDGNKPIGTGFRVSKRLIMTAAHVAKALYQGNSSIQFQYYEDYYMNCPAQEDSSPPRRKGVELQLETFKHTNEDLDYAIIATAEIDDSELRYVKHIYLGDKERLLGKHINILSYPGGSPMKISLRKNLAVSQPQKKKFMTFSEEFVDSAKYTTNSNMILDEADTEGGSSGAPMFNDDFQLIGIHQGWAGLRAEGDTDGNAYVCNRGCYVKTILDDMYAKEGKPSTDFEQKFKGKEAELGVPFK